MKKLSAKFVAKRSMAYTFSVVLVILAALSLLACLAGAFVFGIPALVFVGLAFVCRLLDVAFTWVAKKLDFVSHKAERGVSLSGAGAVSATTGHGVFVPTEPEVEGEDTNGIIFGDRDVEAPSLWAYRGMSPAKAPEEEGVETEVIFVEEDPALA